MFIAGSGCGLSEDINVVSTSPLLFLKHHLVLRKDHFTRAFMHRLMRILRFAHVGRQEPCMMFVMRMGVPRAMTRRSHDTVQCLLKHNALSSSSMTLTHTHRICDPISPRDIFQLRKLQIGNKKQWSWSNHYRGLRWLHTVDIHIMKHTLYLIHFKV